jgi:mono/diheme cytochrome c family protein
VLVPPTAAYCTASTDTPPPNQLFYLDTSGLLALPTDGYICVNKRDNDIPPAVVDTNTKAHALIQDYSAAHGVKNSVWQYYKLVNVQYQPINKDHPTPYGTEPGEKDFLTGHNPSSYYMANIVVETNRPLQMFSGSLVAGATTGSNSDYDSQFGGPAGTAIHHNMFYQGSGYNMGGCMGCHGAQGQSQGGDFSVLLARGRVQIAETPAVPTKNGATRVLRNRELK